MNVIVSWFERNNSSALNEYYLPKENMMICKRLQIVVAWLSLAPLAVCADPVLSADVKAGREIALSRKKGNCVSCHKIDGVEAPGNIGPPLIMIQKRFADKQKLRSQIWDSTLLNPESSMPPFGRHRVISEKEIDLVTEFIWTL
jgi:sulfur-oxidizing protein SoxX